MATRGRYTGQGWTLGSTECQYIIDTITLEGPANTDWHTALGLKP
ncbi:MAG TPA: hypothetical protein VFF47_05275 [Nitrospirota bacterium]|nr:hypothetical protein [Nitrospirota bacterium]